MPNLNTTMTLQDGTLTANEVIVRWLAQIDAKQNELLELLNNQKEERSLSVKEFCIKFDISKHTFYKLQSQGLAPEIIYIAGVQRITPEAQANWVQMMRKLNKGQATELERKRKFRHEQTSAAGKNAVKSPKHISKRKSRTPKANELARRIR